MSCEHFDPDKVLYAYGEGASAEFERHVRLCAACRAEVEEMRGISEAWHSEPEPDAPVRVSFPRRHLGLRLGLAAGALFAFVFALAFDRAGPDPKPIAEKTPNSAEVAAPPVPTADLARLRERVRIIATQTDSMLDRELAHLKRRIERLQLAPDEF